MCIRDSLVTGFGQRQRGARTFPICGFVEHDDALAGPGGARHHVFGADRISTFDAGQCIMFRHGALEGLAIGERAGGDNDFIGADGLGLFGIERRVEHHLHLQLVQLALEPVEIVEDLLAAGLVLTGGASLLPGLTEMAEQVFDMPVRLGNPVGVGGLSDVANSPAFAVGVGLIIYGSKNLSSDSVYRKTGNAFSEFLKTVKKWFLEFF